MYESAKSSVLRYRLFLLIFLLILAALVIPRISGQSYSEETVPPAEVIMDQAVAVDQGVEVSWLDGQSGTHPISGFLIERKRGSGNFEQIGRNEPGSTSFLDPEGRINDTYRVIAIDNQKPANKSTPKETLIAAKIRPGSNVIARTDYQEGVLSAATPTDKTAPLGTRANKLRTQLDKAFKESNEAVKEDNKAYARNALDLLQDYQQTILSIMPELSDSKKKALSGVCKKHAPAFDAASHTLPEDYHLDAMIVQAGCDAIRDLSR